MNLHLSFMKFVRLALSLLLIAVFTMVCSAGNGHYSVQANVDWGTFLARHDLVWNSPSTSYFDAPFVGNGVLGAMFYKQSDQALRLDVGRTDVTDHIPGDNLEAYHRKGRLPIGHFILSTAGTISDCKMRLSLHKAETVGRIISDRGDLEFQLFTHATEPVIVFNLKPTEGEQNAKWQWNPAKSIVPGKPHLSTENPVPTIGKHGNVNICVQPRKDNGNYTTAWREVKLADGTRRLFISIADKFPKGSSVDDAVSAVERAVESDFETFVQAHRKWWQQYYPASFISIPHAKMESYYWIQMYKLGSCIRKDGPLCDLMGPWYKTTVWPGTWWNLNTQMLYWPFPTANRLDMAENLSDALQKNLPNLIASVPEEYRHDSAGISRCTGTDMLEQYDRWKERANLVWTCQNLWVQYRHSMDQKFLRSELYPLLRRGVNLYLHQITKNEDGTYHIPYSHSPEAFYGVDTNYDLATLRWGCKTLLKITKRLGIDDDRADQWQDVLDHLAEYAQNETGYMGGPGKAAPRGHRHWAHLNMIYPYYEVNWDQPENRDVIRRSCEYWSDPKVPNAWSQAVMSSMQSSIGNADGALVHMNLALKSKNLAPNTMHHEGGNPCSETHGGMCQMLHDMLIQSWGDKIRIFPGVPAQWKDAVFHNLRTEGAFLVSAVRSEGKTAWINVSSLAGEPCVIQADFNDQMPKVLAKRNMKLTKLAANRWSLDIKKGESAVLYTGTDAPQLQIVPIVIESEQMNIYGRK